VSCRSASVLMPKCECSAPRRPAPCTGSRPSSHFLAEPTAVGAALGTDSPAGQMWAHYTRVWNDEPWTERPWLDGHECIDRMLATRPADLALAENHAFTWPGARCASTSTTSFTRNVPAGAAPTSGYPGLRPWAVEYDSVGVGDGDAAASRGNDRMPGSTSKGWNPAATVGGPSCQSCKPVQEKPESLTGVRGGDNAEATIEYSGREEVERNAGME
jgi:hypothetical protein